jgi:heat shock protein HtpX
MWELISSNQRKSFVLFILLGLCLAMMGYAFGSYYAPDGGGIFGLGMAVSVWLILSSLAYFSGDSIMLAAGHAKEVKRETSPQLYNIVEEMKIAAGLPAMPKIYIIDDEAMNAFAVGRNPQNSSIAVTAGLLAKLNRDELQGVIAHEMSHIVNRDSMYMTFAGVTLGVITLMSNIFWWQGRLGGMRYRYRSSGNGGGGGQAIIVIVSLVFMILGAILARLLYFAISRRREYLADASAVRLTRYPEGLASALEKISISPVQLATANKVTAPLYISNPFKSQNLSVSNLESTHPPINERIKILRGMSIGAGLANYQDAFEKITGKHAGLIPQSALSENTPVAIRLPGQADTKSDPKDTARTLGNLMMTVNNYLFINCTCGLKIKVPPNLDQKQIICPKCGHEYPLNTTTS